MQKRLMEVNFVGTETLKKIADKWQVFKNLIVNPSCGAELSAILYICL